MVRKSNQNRSALLAALAQGVPQLQNATDTVDEAAAEVLGLNRTDLRALEILSRAGPHAASALATATGLSRGAMTTALDRIERAGYIRRTPDPDDRRGVRVELTEEARRWIERIWGPIAEDGARILQTYETDELAIILRFLEQARALQEAHAERIRALARPTATKRRR
jgi:DNA-binding MarR family transcriptional regulator